MIKQVLMISGAVCPACKRMAPTFERVAQLYAEDKIIFHEYEAMDVPVEFREYLNMISTLPTFLFLAGPLVNDCVSGVVSENRLRELVERLLER